MRQNKNLFTYVKRQINYFALSTLALPSSDYKGQGFHLSQHFAPLAISIINQSVTGIYEKEIDLLKL